MLGMLAVGPGSTSAFQLILKGVQRGSGLVFVQANQFGPDKPLLFGPLFVHEHIHAGKEMYA